MRRLREAGLLREEVLLQGNPASRPVRRPERGLRVQQVLRDVRDVLPGESLLPGTRLLLQARLLRKGLLLQARLLREAVLLQAVLREAVLLQARLLRKGLLLQARLLPAVL